MLCIFCASLTAGGFPYQRIAGLVPASTVTGQISQNGRRKSTWNVPAKNVMIALKVLITPLTTDGHHYTLELQGSPFCGEQRN
jgi:hypothetical protein